MRVDIIPAQRRNLILDYIRQRGVSSVNELGGTILKSSTGTTFEPEYHVSASMAREEKVRIGNLAADKLESYQSVIFDSSSTVFEAARRVAEKGLHLTAATNDLRIGRLLAEAFNVRLIYSDGGTGN